jgi:alkanesulfonate monooxygenase SsuD/methylene tetrahydromethanopterin reductase-like flavin-dependent oxidoreductase (luciferase family)
MWDSDGGEFEHPGTHVDIRGRFGVPRSPQRHPVILQAGDSDPGRELAAATADAIFSRHSRPEAARAFYADVKGRLPRHGRRPEELKIIPATTFALGDTPEEAAARARHIRRQQVSPQTAILLLEQVWNRDLSAYDPDGPLPEVEPDVTSPSIIQGRARMYADPIATAADWRRRAEARNLSIRELVIEVTGRQTFIGTPTQVADAVDDFVQSDAADGVILIPHLTPTGIDDFVDEVVPLLQERGAVRTRYETRTLREHLGLPPTNPASRDRAGSAHA